MKRLFTILLGLVLVFSVISVCGCDNTNKNSSLDNNNTEINNENISEENPTEPVIEGVYVELNKEQISAFINEMGDNDVIVNADISLEGIAKVNISGALTMDLEINYKLCFNEQHYPIMEYETSMFKGNICYYVDNYMYMNTSGLKYKMACSYEEMMADYDVSPMTKKSLKEIFAYYNTQTTINNGVVKVYFDNGKTIKNIKIEIKDLVSNSMLINGTYEYEYDAEYNFISYKADEIITLTINGTPTQEIAYTELRPYSGTINLPNDLNTYKDIYAMLP